MTLPRILFAAWLLFLGSTFSTLAQAPAKVKLKPEVEKFISRMVQHHQFDEGSLRQMFSQLKANDGVVKAINAPATSKPWNEFRNIFVTPTRTSGGVIFWNDNAETLKRARDVYGVPEEIIVAIIGVETIYGKRTGTFRVIESLYTLAFEMPERADYFRGELEQFLLLARENNLDPLVVKGSFAGAIGMPQFMPTSYRKYAVDFDGDGKVDLWDNVPDIIGSVANYLHYFGWAAGQPVAVPARFSGAGYKEVLDKGFKPHLTLAQMLAKGVEPTDSMPPELVAGLFPLEIEQGQEYWLSFNNFYVITRYNRSRNYAMAVYMLANAIAREREAQSLPPPTMSAAQISN
ncbi:MAG TPA: lytic murein transglycosylase B [Burkholderiales bacterium]|nr:lytic murein transglycosylase B [Burkholderiales bacterium]